MCIHLILFTRKLLQNVTDTTQNKNLLETMGKVEFLKMFDSCTNVSEYLSKTHNIDKALVTEIFVSTRSEKDSIMESIRRLP